MKKTMLAVAVLAAGLSSAYAEDEKDFTDLARSVTQTRKDQAEERDRVIEIQKAVTDVAKQVKELKDKVATTAAPAAKEPEKDLVPTSGQDRYNLITKTCTGKAQWEDGVDSEAMKKVLGKYDPAYFDAIVKTCDVKKLQADTREVMRAEEASADTGDGTVDLTKECPKNRRDLYFDPKLGKSGLCIRLY